MKFPKILLIFCIMVVLITSCKSQSAVATSPSEVPTSVILSTATDVSAKITTETTTSIPAQVPLVVSPKSCATSNGQLPSLSNPEMPSVIRPLNSTFGGGLVQSKEFTIELFLYCDAVFQPNASETYFQSDISSLAIYYNRRYDASHESGLINGFWGIEPDIRWQTGEGPSTSQGHIAQGQSTGVRLASNSTYDFSKTTPLRFIYILQTQSGQLSGASLSFDVQHTPDGLQINHVLVTALSDTELESFKSTLPPATP